jgi:hypothetical protein
MPGGQGLAAIDAESLASKAHPRMRALERPEPKNDQR